MTMTSADWQELKTLWDEKAPKPTPAVRVSQMPNKPHMISYTLGLMRDNDGFKPTFHVHERFRERFLKLLAEAHDFVTKLPGTGSGG